MILLKNGLMYDGSKNPPRQVDIYIENGKISKIAKEITIKVANTIDCSGLCISPGFIDAHSHNDFFVESETLLPFLKQGITTQIVGNCGISAFGVNPNSQFKDLVGSGLFKTSDPQDLNNFIENNKDKLMLNLVPLIGHGTARASVTGYDAKPLNPQQQQEMLDLTETAMKQGAFGGSLGLMYQPGMFANRDEIVEFAKIIKKYDGILTVHTRANSKIALGYPLISKKSHIELGLEEIIDIILETGVRMEYSHLIFVGKSSWKYVDVMQKRIQEINDQGYQLGYDLYPFPYGASVITVILPSWYLKLSTKDRKKKTNLFKLKLIINITKSLLGISFADLVISHIKNYPQYEGKNIEELARTENMKPIDMYIKLVELSNGKGGIMLGKYYNDDIIKKLMLDDLSIYMTDAWYEQAGIQNAGTYQAFPFFLTKSLKYNINIENTIHKMTGATADRFKIKNRGYIKPGYAADITIFDINKIEIPNQPNQTPPGIEYVIVNGNIAINNREYIKSTSGEIIKKL